MKSRPQEAKSETVGGYAPWLRRAAAAILDLLPVVILAALAIALMWLTRDRVCDTDPSVGDYGPRCGDAGVGTVGQACYLACWLAILGYCVWNLGLRQGTSGASVGKSALRIRVVDLTTREPIGFRRSVIRQLTHALDVLTVGVGYLWPLWDRRRQTFADKLSATVCVSGTR